MTLEKNLKERIKELTCLYEVSSIIGNANAALLSDTLQAIGFSIKKGFQFPKKTEIEIITESYKVSTKNDLDNTVKITSQIKVFNDEKGQLIAHLNASEFTAIVAPINIYVNCFFK